MKNLHLAAIALLLPMLSGCAPSAYPLAFDSNPQGATVICDGASGLGAGNKGYTPTVVWLDKSKMKNNPYSPIDLNKCSANWASGVKANYKGEGPVGWLQEIFPNGSVRAVDRPKAPGLAQDNQFASQVQRMRMQQAAAQQQETSAIQVFAAVLQGLAAFSQGFNQGYNQVAASNQSWSNINQSLMNQINQNNANLANYNRSNQMNIHPLPTGSPSWTPVTTTRAGNTYFNSDGSSTTRAGDTYFHSDGSSTMGLGR